MSETIIFTECFNCAPICQKMLESFVKNHDKTIYVFGSKADFDLFEEPVKGHHNIELIAVEGIQSKFDQGHLGTAYIFANAFTRWRGEKIIHIDSDIIFKRESISLIESEFENGIDIIGSRRCYKNNPVNIPVPDHIPDSMSTYFLGINSAKLPSYDLEILTKMWQGAYHPLGWMILDFGDPVIHAIMNNGGTVKYLDYNFVGGQDVNGRKNSLYPSNLNMDMGYHLVHFGGVGSGYSVYSGKFMPVKSYADWALSRYALWCKLWDEKDIVEERDPPKFDENGRWISGWYDDKILEQIRIDLQN